MRLESKVKVTRIAKYAILIYIVISLFYTTNHYFSSHHVNTVNRKEEINQHMDALAMEKQQELLQVKSKPKQHAIIEEDIEDNSQVTWPGSKGKIEKKKNKSLLFTIKMIGSDTKHRISEELIKSKLFSSSMGLDNVTPYYFKASHIMKVQDITLATLVTRNRFKVLSRLATNYQGKISKKKRNETQLIKKKYFFFIFCRPDLCSDSRSRRC
jgi:hypothetical protein